MGKQPIKGGHCYILDGLWTVCYSIAQSPTFHGGHPSQILHILHAIITGFPVKIRVFMCLQKESMCGYYETFLYYRESLM